MTDSTDLQVTVELQDAATVTTDVLVIPSTTQGSFGEPWHSVVGRMGLLPSRSPIPFGEVRMEPVGVRADRVSYAAFAATVDADRPTTRTTVSRIGAALGRLTTDSRYSDIRDIVTPILGTGAGQLDPLVSLQALVEGYLATANPSARLRVIEVDQSRYTMLDNALAHMILPFPEAQSSTSEGSFEDSSGPLTGDPEPSIWDALAPDALEAIHLAEAYRRAVGSSRIHMEQLVTALYQSADTSVRSWFGEVDESQLVEMTAAVTGTTILLDVLAKPLTALPQLSQHVSDAMAAAWELGKADLPLTVGHLLAGALSIECSFIAALRERGVRQGPFTAPPTQTPDRPTVMAEPAADTVPEVDLALSDRLNLGREVEMLASVMLASDTPLPLAIGLFGDWGSGKSFFMRMLDERMAELAALQLEVLPPEEPIYCRHIRQVHFNAWHYVDGNLWASLAATIFEGLVDETDPTVQEQKRDQLGEATKAAIEARDVRVKAEQTLRQRQEKAGQVSTIVLSAVPAALKALRQAGNLREELDAKGTMSEAAEQFVAAADAARATGRQTALLTGLVWSELKGRWAATLAWFLVVGVIVGVGILLSESEAWVEVLVAVPVVLTSLAPALRGATGLLRSAQEARWSREQPVVDAQNKLAKAELKERLANEEVAAREADLERLRDRGARLQDLVRSARLEYGAQLSMVSQLRKDFEELTWLLKSKGGASQELKQAAATLCADGTLPADDAGTGPEPKLATPAPLDVDRIVLYIDDLDRCSAKDVVKVLQAVNLLLTFKLFVVVIGVDGRWLEASLSRHYDRLLRSPVEYLEKIIQLPFVLRPMSPDGYVTMVDDLTTARLRARPKDAGQGGSGDRRDAEEDRYAGVSSGQPDVPADGTETLAVETSRTAGAAEIVVPRPRAPQPESLVISEPERKLLRKVGGLITTPRTTKRFVNTYRMVRVCAGDTAADKFSPDGDGEYQAVIVLLAILMGCPDAKDIFDRIMNGAPDADVWTLMKPPPKPAAATEEPATESTESTESAVPAVGTRPDSIKALQDLVDLSAAGAYQRWIPLVSRFTYHLPSVVAPTPESV